MTISSGQQITREEWCRFKSINHAESVSENFSVMDELFIPANEIIGELSEILRGLGRDMEYDDDGETVITDDNGDLFEYIDPISEQIISRAAPRMR